MCLSALCLQRQGLLRVTLGQAGMGKVVLLIIHVGAPDDGDWGEGWGNFSHKYSYVWAGRALYIQWLPSDVIFEICDVLYSIRPKLVVVTVPEDEEWMALIDLLE